MVIGENLAAFIYHGLQSEHAPPASAAVDPSALAAKHLSYHLLVARATLDRAGRPRSAASAEVDGR